MRIAKWKFLEIFSFFLSEIPVSSVYSSVRHLSLQNRDNEMSGQHVKIISGRFAGRVGTVVETDAEDYVILVEFREDVTGTMQKFPFYRDEVVRDDLRLCA